MKKIFTREEAIEFLNCNENIRPYRIIEGLEKCGFKNIEKVGRGQKISFICEQPDDTDEQCFYMRNQHLFDLLQNFPRLKLAS